MVVGVPLAVGLYLFRMPLRTSISAAVLLPFVMPTLVTGLAIQQMFAGSIDEGLVAVVSAHVLMNIAVIVRFCGLALQTVSPQELVVAQSLGASRMWAILTIALPRCFPAMKRASGLVFIYAFTSLGIILTVGGGATTTLETLMLRQITLLLDFSAAAVIASVQFIVVLLVFLLTKSNMGNLGSTATYEPEWQSSWWQQVLVLGTGALFLSPYVYLLAKVFQADLQYIIYQRWEELQILGTLSRTVAIALSAALVAATLAMMAAMVAIQNNWSAQLMQILFVPLGLSSITLGLALNVGLARPPIDLPRGPVLTAALHVLAALPVCYALAEVELRRYENRMSVVAATLGASPLRALWTGLVPIMLPSFFSAAAIAMAMSLGEFGAASFLNSVDAPTMSVQISRLLGRPGEVLLQSAVSLSAMLAVVTVVSLSLLTFAGAKSVGGVRWLIQSWK
jgi:thiamine transport system permease protein